MYQYISPIYLLIADIAIHRLTGSLTNQHDYRSQHCNYLLMGTETTAVYYADRGNRIRLI